MSLIDILAQRAANSVKNSPGNPDAGVIDEPVGDPAQEDPTGDTAPPEDDASAPQPELMAAGGAPSVITPGQGSASASVQADQGDQEDNRPFAEKVMDNNAKMSTKGHILAMLIRGAIGGAAGAGSPTIGAGFSKGFLLPMQIMQMRQKQALAQRQADLQQQKYEEQKKVDESTIAKNEAYTKYTNSRPTTPQLHGEARAEQLLQEKRTLDPNNPQDQPRLAQIDQELEDIDTAQRSGKNDQKETILSDEQQLNKARAALDAAKTPQDKAAAQNQVDLWTQRTKADHPKSYIIAPNGEDRKDANNAFAEQHANDAITAAKDSLQKKGVKNPTEDQVEAEANNIIDAYMQTPEGKKDKQFLANAEAIRTRFHSRRTRREPQKKKNPFAPNATDSGS